MLPTLRSLLTGNGGIPYGVAGGAPAQLALGAKGYGLLAGATAPQYDRITRKNRLINGSMYVSQRRAIDNGVALVDNTYQIQDRWRILAGHTAGSPGTCQASYTIGTVAGSSRGTFAFQSGGGTGKFGIFQVIEGKDCFDLRGQVVSLQAKIGAAGSSFGDIRMAVLQWAGAEDATTGDPISAWNAAGTPPTLAANWTYAATPAQLGVAGTHQLYKAENIAIASNINNLAVMIWCDDTATTSTEFLLMNDVQLEAGSVCTDFERIPFVEELLRCQRYYAKTFPIGTTPAQNTGVSGGALAYRVAVAGTVFHGVPWRFPTRMRAIPTITYYNPGAANTNWRNLSSGADSGTSSTQVPGDAGIMADSSGAAGDTVGQLVVIHATADAEL